MRIKLSIIALALLFGTSSVQGAGIRANGPGAPRPGSAVKRPMVGEYSRIDARSMKAQRIAQTKLLRARLKYDRFKNRVPPTDRATRQGLVESFAKWQQKDPKIRLLVEFAAKISEPHEKSPVLLLVRVDGSREDVFLGLHQGQLVVVQGRYGGTLHPLGGDSGPEVYLDRAMLYAAAERALGDLRSGQRGYAYAVKKSDGTHGGWYIERTPASWSAQPLTLEESPRNP